MYCYSGIVDTWAAEEKAQSAEALFSLRVLLWKFSRCLRCWCISPFTLSDRQMLAFSLTLFRSIDSGASDSVILELGCTSTDNLQLWWNIFYLDWIPNGLQIKIKQFHSCLTKIPPASSGNTDENLHSVLEMFFFQIIMTVICTQLLFLLLLVTCFAGGFYISIFCDAKWSGAVCSDAISKMTSVPFVCGFWGNKGESLAIRNPNSEPNITQR